MSDGQNGDTWAGDSSTIASVGVGASINGTLETNDDLDWIAVNLVAGQNYTMSLSGTGADPVSDTYLRVWAPGSANPGSGTLVAYNDDGGPGLYSQATFTAPSSGTYYIDARSYNGETDGEYQVSVVETPPLTVWTHAEIASQLTDGFWASNGAQQRSFNVGADNSITVDISGLSASYQAHARAALDSWTDITGIQFTEITGAAEIEFQSSGGGAYSTSSTTGTTINSSIVNVNSSWEASQGTQYTLQTFIHEIGHAIGLGHAGNYNGSASYGTDNHYLNDSWQASIMSYFSQTDNTYVSASFNYLLTPMVADILATQDLYGASTTTRTGDTVYGYNSNAGDVYEFDNWMANYGHSTFALTIVDSGGNDTIDLSGSSTSNVINLVAGTFSSVLGSIGNLSIAAGTTIENAYGGDGADSLTGNAASNILRGGSGNDTLDGGAGNDAMLGGAGNDRVFFGLGDRLYDSGQVRSDGGDDYDTAVLDDGFSWDTYNWSIYGFEAVEGNDLDNIINGRNDEVDYNFQGGGGNDTITTAGGDDTLIGGAGTDTLDGGVGNDAMLGGAGNDRVFFGLGDRLYDSGQVRSDGGDDYDTAVLGDGFSWDTYNWSLYGFEAVEGNDLDNIINGRDNSVDYNFQGGGGNDTITTAGGNDTLIGGAGTDTLTGGANADIFEFGTGWGEDTVTDWSFAEGDTLRFNAITGLTQFDDLTITYGSDAEVAFGNDTVTLTGITSGLTSGDFDFI